MAGRGGIKQVASTTLESLKRRPQPLVSLVHCPATTQLTHPTNSDISDISDANNLQVALISASQNVIISTGNTTLQGRSHMINHLHARLIRAGFLSLKYSTPDAISASWTKTSPFPHLHLSLTSAGATSPRQRHNIASGLNFANHPLIAISPACTVAHNGRQRVCKSIAA